MGKAPKTDYGSGMTSEGTGIGSHVVEADDPPFKPKVLDADGNEVDVDTIEDDAAADEADD